jgi:hypothetical protein
MCSIMKENPKDAEMWVEAFDAKFEGKGKPWGREEFDQVLGHCMVFLLFSVKSFVLTNLRRYQTGLAPISQTSSYKLTLTPK